MTYPIDVVVAVTYRCQARCRMCSVWQIQEHHDVEPDVYAKLPLTLRDVNISGGEPFLRRDLEKIVTVIHRRLPRARIVISTNGLMGEGLLVRAEKILAINPRVGFAFSIDGIGAMHDEIRGIPGGYERTLAAVRALKKAGIENLRIAYTLTSRNADHLGKVYDLACNLGVEFTMQVSHDSDFYFGSHDLNVVGNDPKQMSESHLSGQFRRIIRGELASWKLRRWGRAFLFAGSHQLATRGTRPFGARPGFDFFFLDPRGDVYPSVIHNHVMGNLARDDFDTIWGSDRSEEVRRKCAEEAKPYWLGCMLRKALLEHRLQIGFWVLKHKFLPFLDPVK